VDATPNPDPPDPPASFTANPGRLRITRFVYQLGRKLYDRADCKWTGTVTIRARFVNGEPLELQVLGPDGAAFRAPPG
jgi:hypothetical protein